MKYFARSIACLFAVCAEALRFVSQDFHEKQGAIPKINCEPFQKPTAVFAAGIEGTGHHLLHALFNKEMRDSPQDFGVLHGFGYQPMTSTNITCGKCYALGPLGEGVVKHLADSYPRGRPSHRPGIVDLKKYCPDINLLYKKSVQRGFELRIIFTMRDLVHTLVSGCIHRNFEPCERYVKTLVKATNILIPQLRLWRSHVDRAKPVCFRYGNATSMAQVLTTVLRDEKSQVVVADAWNESSTDSLAKLDEYPEKDEWISTLKNHTLLLEEECSQMEQMNHESFLKSLVHPSKTTHAANSVP